MADNDGDGFPDCLDVDDCQNHPSCQICPGAVEIQCGDSFGGNTSGGLNNISVYTGCGNWEEQGPEDMYYFRATESMQLEAVLTNIEEGQDLDIFILEGGCTAAHCKEQGDSLGWSGVEPGIIYYILVDGYSGNQGSYTLTLTCH